MTPNLCRWTVHPFFSVTYPAESEWTTGQQSVERSPQLPPSRSALRLPPSGTCPKHLPWETSEKRPVEMPKPPQLALFTAADQWPSSEPRHHDHLKEAHFGYLEKIACGMFTSTSPLLRSFTTLNSQSEWAISPTDLRPIQYAESAAKNVDNADNTRKINFHQCSRHDGRPIAGLVCRAQKVMVQADSITFRKRDGFTTENANCSQFGCTLYGP